MLKKFAYLFALLALMLVGSAFCLDGKQLSGSWTINWPSDGKNQPQNDVSLTYRDGSFSGVYISDDKESCPVSGALAEKTGHAIFHIRCAKWGIELEGTAALNGKTIKGDYNWPGSDGPFTLIKHESQ